jgi:enoyl-CoA hydratase/carnithine racemase
MNRALLTAFRPSSATAKSIRTNASLVQITDEPIVRRITMINLKQRNPLGLDMIRALQPTAGTTDFARCRILVLGCTDDKIFSAERHELKELTTEKDRQMHQLVFDEFSKLCLNLPR